MSTASTAQQAREFFTGLQQRVVERLEQVDGTRFHRDQWERAEGGGGLICVMEEGNVLERGGSDMRMDSVRPPDCRPNRVPRSHTRLNST